MNDPAVQMLLDRAAVIDTVNRYATAIDTRDWALLRSCFTEDLEADFTSFGVREVAHGADGWVEAVRATIDGLDASQHVITNHVVDVDGDTATCVAYIQAEHFLANDRGDNFYTIGGYYTEDLVRTGDGWKIRKYAITVTWHRGNRDVLRQAARRLRSA